jgi:OCT family organic cation transporter-like MFS transporter 4/5
MNYDDLLAHIGSFSTLQLRNYILLCIPIILCAFHKLSNVFILAKMDHRCKLASNDVNFYFTDNSTTNQYIFNASYPHDETKGFSKCEYFTDNYFAINSTNHEVKTCSAYVWNYEKFQSSAINSFELICERDYYKAMSDSLFMIGVFIGSFMFGHLSDRYGRKKVFVISLISQLVFGLLTAISSNFISFTIFRMVRYLSM